jgi:parvulin-like peptidyl-prolyl isomerase
MPFRRGAALCAGLLMLAACAERNDGETVLARVDGDAVTESDFRRELGLRPFARQEYLETLPGRKEMLELLVRRRIVLSEAERTSFVRRPDVKKKVDDIDAEFRRRQQDAREQLIVGEYFRHLQERDLKVTDQDVRDFWSNEKEVRAAHILFQDAAGAQKALERLKGGAKFESLAKELSQDPATGRQGGDLGWLMRGTLVPEFEEALFSLKPGEVSGAVESPYGFHVVRKTDERALAAAPFEQSAEKIRAVLEKRKFQAWIDETKKRHSVTTDAAALQDLKIEPPRRTP